MLLAEEPGILNVDTPGLAWLSVRRMRYNWHMVGTRADVFTGTSPPLTRFPTYPSALICHSSKRSHGSLVSIIGPSIDG